MKNKQCESCHFNKNKEVSPKALERIYYLQSSGSKSFDIDSAPGCKYAINSSEYNYCFWEMASQLNSPMSDKKIRSLLCINYAQLRSIYDSAIKKLTSNNDTDIMKELKDILLAKIHLNQDNSFESPDYKETEKDESEVETEESIIEDIEKMKRKYASMTGQPIHRDGKKVDLYGLSRKKKSNK